MKVRVEWKDGDVWRPVLVDVAVSRNGNLTFKYDGKVCVFKTKREGEPVLVLDTGKHRWMLAGRVTRVGVFLGEGISSDEYFRTTEGMKIAKQTLESFLANRSTRAEAEA